MGAPERHTVEDVFGQSYVLTPGVVDDAACDAFLYGHCAELALALHRRTGWPLKVVVQSGVDWVVLSAAGHRAADLDRSLPIRELRELWAHVVVERPDGQLLDILGPQDPDTLLARYDAGLPTGAPLDDAADRHRIVTATADDVEGLHSIAPPAPVVAELFVDAVLALPEVAPIEWPWARTLPEYLRTALTSARDHADEDNCDYLDYARDVLVDLDDDLHLLGEALRRNLLPVDLVDLAQGLLESSPTHAA